MIWITDADGRVTFASQGWLAFRGTTADNDLSCGWLDALDSRRLRDLLDA